MNIVHHDKEAKEKKEARSKWREEAFYCKLSSTGSHDYMPVSTIVSPKLHSVSQLMCKICFHCVSVAQAMRKD